MIYGTSALKLYADGLSSDQQYAVEMIMAWRNAWPGSEQIFTLGGFAGTGKTTIIAYLANYLPSPVVACPTGKAANVLRNKGVDASTIHVLIYDVRSGKRETPRFRRKRCLDAQTIIIDEASMVESKIYCDLCMFSLPILFVGDHGQLEPIGENPNLMKNPDVRLERIHRQAENNPIIRLAAAFREGRFVPSEWRDQENRCIITTQAHFDEYVFSGAQIIVGLNSTRHEINKRIRNQRGFRGPPCPGERLICLRNSPTFGLFNGEQCTVVSSYGSGSNFVELELELDDGRQISAPCRTEQFGRKLIENHRDKNVLLLDFGYALTVHKAQGSEYDGVVVLEQITGGDAQRWRYTAVTRARERIVYCR